MIDLGSARVLVTGGAGYVGSVSVEHLVESGHDVVVLDNGATDNPSSDLLDATVVRSILVPSAMALLGDRNWYLPRWLAWLPDLRVEGPPAPAAAPAPLGVPVVDIEPAIAD